MFCIVEQSARTVITIESNVAPITGPSPEILQVTLEGTELVCLRGSEEGFHSRVMLYPPDLRFEMEPLS